MPKNNTIINKTFSKKDLLKIIDEFKITIAVGENHTKSVVANTLWDILFKMNYLEIPKNNSLLVKDLQELRSYLKKPNPRKPLTIKDKDNITHLSKKVNHYCENCYDIDLSLYTNIQEVYNDADIIKHHGDIPIVRKTIRKLMNDPNKLYNIKPILSPHVQHDIDLKKSLNKKTSHYKCEVKHGTFILTFD